MSDTATATYADVAEQVRALLAALAQAQDDGRTDDLVSLYAEDGVVDVPGLGPSRARARCGRRSGAGRRRSRSATS